MTGKKWNGNVLRLYWQASSRETELVLPSQSVVVLQHLVWLCRPMREWQSLLHMAQMKLEDGKVELFCSEHASLQLSGDISHLLSQFLLSLSVSSGHNHWQQLPNYLDQFRML